jgi:hypothetical protein
VGPPRSATTALRCCLPPNGRRRLPRQILISGLNHTAHALAVYASQRGLLHHHARLASGGWPILPGGAAYPPGPTERFQVIPSSFPRLRLAHPFHSICNRGPAWRAELSSANAAGLAVRLAFPLLASLTILPLVSPGIALMAGIAVALTVGNPYPMTRRAWSPLCCKFPSSDSVRG